MAAVKDARNVSPTINLKCHPDRVHNYVSCTLCDEPFCEIDFARKVKSGKGFFISNTLVFCPEHSITYKDSHVNNMIEDDYDSHQVLKLKIEILQKELEDININSTILSVDDASTEEDEEYSQSKDKILSIG